MEIRPLNFNAVNSTYQSLLPYPLLKRIQAKRDLNRLIGFEAFEQEQPIGCIVLEHFNLLHKGQILAWTPTHLTVMSDLFFAVKNALRSPNKTILDYFYIPSSDIEALIIQFQGLTPLLKLKRFFF